MINNIGSRSAFSGKMGIPKTTVRVWFDGKHRPSLESLLKICYFSDIYLSDFLCGKYNTFNINPHLRDKQKPRIEVKRKAFNKEGVQRTLLALLKEQPPISMNEVARRLHYDKRILYKHFPELCKEISQKHLNFIQECRDQRIKEACIRVNEATIQLYNRGIYPSRRRVEGLLQTEILREKPLQDAWRETLMSLGLSIRNSK